jgi:hypothetical protein
MMQFIKVLPCKWIKLEYIIAIKVIEDPYSVLLISPHGGLPDLLGEYGSKEEAEKAAQAVLNLIEEVKRERYEVRG